MSTLTVRKTTQAQTRDNALLLRILEEVQELRSEVRSAFSEGFPEESLDDYEHPERIRASFRKALREYKEGKTRSAL